MYKKTIQFLRVKYNIALLAGHKESAEHYLNRLSDIMRGENPK